MTRYRIYKSRTLPGWVAMNTDPQRLDLHAFWTWGAAMAWADREARKPLMSRYAKGPGA